jgi:hypothetical protein
MLRSRASEKAEAGNYQRPQTAGEWAESVFAVRAAENGLPVSKPFGDSGSFDCVVGRPGKFVGVQVKLHGGEDRERRGICLFGVP